MGIPYQKLLHELNQSHIRYLIAGGFALNFHQINRSTIDLDIILHLEKENILAFHQVMSKLGYQLRQPIDIHDFTTEQNRQTWLIEKNMVMLSYYNSHNFMEIVDVFVSEPIPFIDIYPRRLEIKAFDMCIPVVGLDDLIEMKQIANRDKDQYDIKMLLGIKNGTHQ